MHRVCVCASLFLLFCFVFSISATSVWPSLVFYQFALSPAPQPLLPAICSLVAAATNFVSRRSWALREERNYLLPVRVRMTKKVAWRRRVKRCTTANELAAALLELWECVRADGFNEVWQEHDSESWLEGVFAATSVRDLAIAMHELLQNLPCVTANDYAGQGLLQQLRDLGAGIAAGGSVTETAGGLDTAGDIPVAGPGRPADLGCTAPYAGGITRRPGVFICARSKSRRTEQAAAGASGSQGTALEPIPTAACDQKM
jgi:hypothetical protein